MTGPALNGSPQAWSSCTCDRQLTQMSRPLKPGAPRLPGRSLTKNIQWPSRENAAALSSNPSTLISRHSGGFQDPSVEFNRATQIFRSSVVSPAPHGRVELKYRLVPSFESVGAVSAKGLLIVGPRLTGSDHCEKCVASIVTASCSEP